MVRIFKYIMTSVLMLGLIGAFAIFVLDIPLPWQAAAQEAHTPPPPRPALPAIQLAGNVPHTLELPEAVRRSLGIRRGDKDMLAVATPPTQSRPLVMPGSTALDPARVIRIRVRFFPAEVVKIGEHGPDRTAPGATRSEFRELRPGDVVREGDELAVFQSVDVGSKKNDLFEAIIQYRLDKVILDKAEAAAGSLPEAFLWNARRNVQTDRSGIIRAKNTLKTWNIAEEDIEGVVKEAEQYDLTRRTSDKVNKQEADWGKKQEEWSRVVVRWGKKPEGRPPQSGVIIERNLARGETIVDGATNLFTIAQVDRLAVLTNLPEDDLPKLQSLRPEQRVWTIQTVGATAVQMYRLSDEALARLRESGIPDNVLAKLNALRVKMLDRKEFVEGLTRGLSRAERERYQALLLKHALVPGLPGTVDEIGYLIDPNQHTAIIKGYIDNPGGKIRAGQFVSATVNLPPPTDVVEVPIESLVDDGKQSLVFVQADAEKHRYTMKHVVVMQRFEKTAFISSKPIPPEEQLTPAEAEQGLLPREPLRDGDVLLTSGVLELKAALLEKEARQPPQEHKIAE